MDKELEALERIRSHNYHELPKRECLRIIEIALKKGIVIEKAFNALSKEHEILMKELSKEIEKNRPLEIIKNYFFVLDYQDFITLDGRLPKKCKEKCDLLKEAMGSL